jgi:type 1 glutamine amidotransferase
MKGTLALALLLMVVLIAKEPAAAEKDSKIENQRILFFGGGPHHPYRDCSDVLFNYLADFAIYDCTYTEEPSALHWDSLKAYDVLLIYAIQFDHQKETPEPVREGLQRFLKEGKGLVVVHAGVASFSTWPQFTDIIGAYWRWGKSTHDPYRHMMVEIADPDHPITRDLLDFKIIDEFYFNLEPRAGNHLLLISTHQVEGKERTEPIAWTRTEEDARVFVTLLGHDATPWKNVSFLKIMRRGIDWAARRLD